MTLDARLLSELRQAGRAGIGSATLSLRVRQDANVVAARLSELGRLGYEIEASPHFGFRLVASPDMLHADDLISRGPRRRSRSGSQVRANVLDSPKRSSR